MRPSWTSPWVCLTLALYTFGHGHVQGANLSQKISRAHFEFSLDLYREMTSEVQERKDKSGNLVYSPYSVNSLLAMLFLGTSSGSDSSRQLRSALRYDDISYVDIHKAFKDIVEVFKDKYYGDKVHMAAGLFLQDGIHVSAPYKRALSEFYHTTIESVDFRNSLPARSMSALNDWTSDATEGRIPRVASYPPGRDSKLVATNAMSVNSRWLHPFDRADTFDKGLFFLPGNRRLEVPMMSGRYQLPIGYSSELECRILELPFAQRRLSMFLILPDDPADGLQRLEGNLTSENVKALFSKLEDEIVNVRLPRFRLSSDADVASSLKGIGVRDIFSSDASDLQLMAPDINLHLSSIAHRSVVTVTEDGFRSSSSSSSSSRSRSPPSSSGSSFGQKFFEVDHPFLFLVWDYYSGMLLLMGRVLHPTTTEE